MDERIESLEGQVQALNVVLLQVLRVLDRSQAIELYDYLGDEQENCLDDDSIQGAPPAVTRAREAILDAYMELLAAQTK